MASCSSCTGKAVFSYTGHDYCKQHFISSFESKVKATIERFALVGDAERVAVAVSGGKDSQTILYILHSLYGDRVHAVAIDEGIPGYRDEKLDDLRMFCAQYSVPLSIYSFEESFGKPLTRFLSKGAPACRSCGVLRRSLLNKYAANFDVIATGHNLDDECQNIVLNLLKGNLSLSARLGPVSGVATHNGFTPRIKPLYLCTEKEVATYAFLKGFPVRFNECPHASNGFRSKVRDALNGLEAAVPGTKLRIVENFLALLPVLEDACHAVDGPELCNRCGSLCAGGVCNACKVVEVFSDAS